MREIKVMIFRGDIAKLSSAGRMVRLCNNTNIPALCSVTA